MKFLHISCMRELTSGQRKQLTFEYDACKRLGIDWDIVALHTGKIEDSRFEIQIPKFFKKMFLRNLYTWFYMLKNQKKYNVIINRHMTFDPFALTCGWFVKNRFTVHHAKEVEALKAVKKNWKGKLASTAEKLTGFISLKQSKGAICVTSDIALYQDKRANIQTFLYPNGIDLSSIRIIEDKRVRDEVNIAFMCGTFSAWHGLDLFLESALVNLELIQSNNIKIHLIGRVLEKELNFIKTKKLPIVLYGLLSSEEYIKVLEKCDIGLDSLALYREGLNEGAALKVREYLAFGLPIYSAYKDTAIPLDFQYYKVDDVDIKKMFAFAKQMKQFSRQEVRSISEEYISKEILLKKLYRELEEFYCKR
ncbi:hypothetical protein [Aliarcobacter cryaerophilus]|uniref:hypothetical protein n=1 Tax=Aliarcobacter cryaerophilus TaxID=28198 RepID=UPI003AF337B7